MFAIRVVVVGEFLAGLDVSASADPDLPADDLAVAIWFAGVVDETSHVAAHGRVTYPAAIDGEAPDLTAFEVFGLALEALLVIDELAVVSDDARVLVDGLEGKDAPPVER